MVWDLRRALLAKEEFESGRLDNFDFRQRVRAMRLLAAALGADEDALVALVPLHPEDTAFGPAAEIAGCAEEEVRAVYARCDAEAQRQLIGEIGDPTPHRLA